MLLNQAMIGGNMVARFILVVLLGCSLGAAQNRPDILFIAVDDLNDWVGVLGGHPQAKTPNIDKLASRGMLFTNAHTPAPSCGPARAAILTGVRPSTSGVYGNRDNWLTAPKLKRTPTLPKYLRSKGYLAIGGGKIFHGSTYLPRGLRGHQDPSSWDEFYPSKTRQLHDEVRPLGWPLNKNPGFEFSLFDWAPVVVDDEAMGDGQLASWAARELGKKRDKPLFLATGFYRPHLPWYVPQRYFDMYPLEAVELPAVMDGDLDDLPAYAQHRLPIHRWVLKNNYWKKAVQGYLASITYADAMIGRVIDALDGSGRADNTLIVLWSDHGYHLGEKETWAKFTLWEESTRVPLIVIAPGVTQPGKSTAKPASLLDLYPTLVELAGLAVPKHAEGKSLVPLLKDTDAKWDHAAVTTWGFANHSIRTERHRYIRYADGTRELYDHRNDPHEWTNLLAAGRASDAEAQLERFLPELNELSINGTTLQIGANPPAGAVTP